MILLFEELDLKTQVESLLGNEQPSRRKRTLQKSQVK